MNHFIYSNFDDLSISFQTSDSRNDKMIIMRPGLSAASYKSFKHHLRNGLTAEMELPPCRLPPELLVMKVVDSDILDLAGVTIWMKKQNTLVNDLRACL